MEPPAKRAKTSAEGLETEGAASSLQEAAVKTPTTFYTLPYELRSEIYYLAGIPTKTIFDLMEKPIFHGAAYWSDFFVTDFCDLSQSFDVDLDSETDNHPVHANASHSREHHEDQNDTEKTTEDDQATPDKYADDAVEDYCGGTRKDRSKTIQGLLLASQQVRDEVLDILYGENIFCVDLFKAGRESNTALDGERILEAVKEGKSERFRHIMMVLLDPPTADYWEDEFVELGPDPASHYKLTVDKDVWDSVLPNLKSLRILVTSPRLPLLAERNEHIPFCQYLMAIDQWDHSVEQLLRYLSKVLLPETALLMDFRAWPMDYHWQVALDDLVESHANHQEINTMMGNYVEWSAGFCPEHEGFCDHGYKLHVCDWCGTEPLRRSQSRKQQVKSQSDHTPPGNDEALRSDNVSESEEEPDDNSSQDFESEDGLQRNDTSDSGDRSGVESIDQT